MVQLDELDVTPQTDNSTVYYGWENRMDFYISDGSNRNGELM